MIKVPFNITEIRDEACLEFLRSSLPDAEEIIKELPRIAKTIPVYDDKECEVVRELYWERAYGILLYIEGNDDPKDNGWILRLFFGVKQNSDLQIAIFNGFQEFVKGRAIPV